MEYELFQFNEILDTNDSLPLQSEIKEEWKLFYEFLNSLPENFFQNGINIISAKLGGPSHAKKITISHLCHAEKTISKPILSYTNAGGFVTYRDYLDDIDLERGSQSNDQNLNGIFDYFGNYNRTNNIPIVEEAEEDGDVLTLDSIVNIKPSTMVLTAGGVLKIPLIFYGVIGEVSVEPFTREEIEGLRNSHLVFYILKRVSSQMKRYKYDRLLKLFVEYSCADPISNKFFDRLTVNLCYYLNVKYAFVCSIESGVGKTISFCEKGKIHGNFEYELQGTPCGEIMYGKPVFFGQDLQRIFPKDLWLIDNSVESYLGIPLTSTDGKMIGSLCVMNDKVMSSDHSYTSILAALANKTTIELERRKALRGYLVTQELMDQSPTAIFLTKSSGQIINSYGALHSLFGYKEEEICGRSIDSLQAMNETSIGISSPNQLLSTLSAQYIELKEVKKEIICIQKSGDTFPAEVCVRSIYDTVSGENENRFLGRMFVIRDIKETKLYQQKLLEMNKQLQVKNNELVDARDRALQAIACKSHFIATISHEIRTPMNAVIGMTELLLSSKLAGEQLTIAEEIYKSSELLLSITSDCLDFSKIEASKLELEIIDFDFMGCIEGAVETLSISLINKPIEFLLTFDKGVPRHAKGDPNKIRQVILNMGYNSIKYTNSGHIYISISAETQTNARTGRVCHKILCRVEDTGIGISENQKIHLFQPFAQMDTSVSRKYGGTGLGLTICKEISKLMNGDVTLVESTPGKGSEFLFTAVLEPSQVESNYYQYSEPIDLSLLTKSNILLVDDYEFGRNILIKKLYQELSCSVTSLSSKELIQQLTDHSSNSRNRSLPKFLTSPQGQIFDLILIVERELFTQNTNFFNISDQIQDILDSSSSKSNLVLCTNFKLHNTQCNSNHKFIIIHKPLSPTQISKVLNANKLKFSTLVSSSKRKLIESPTTPQLESIKKIKLDPSINNLNAQSFDNAIFINSTHKPVAAAGDDDHSKRLKWNILLVEDNAVNRKVLSMQLKKLGFKCECANDGSEAIEKFKTGKYDLIFMDLTMPIIDGPTATLQIRSYEEICNKSKKVVIVALTATVLEGSSNYCRSLGMDDFLMKPLKISDLEKVLLYYLPDNQIQL